MHNPSLTYDLVCYVLLKRKCIFYNEQFQSMHFMNCVYVTVTERLRDNTQVIIHVAEYVIDYKSVKLIMKIRIGRFVLLKKYDRKLVHVITWLSYEFEAE